MLKTEIDLLMTLFLPAMNYFIQLLSVVKVLINLKVILTAISNFKIYNYT